MTKFSVTCFKGKENESAYTVNLGQDILDGKTEDEIRAMATQSAVITLQGKLRKCETALEMETKLTGYELATVDEGVIKDVSPTTLLKRMIAEHGIEKVTEMLAKKQD